jgi:hypothetical protein
MTESEIDEIEKLRHKLFEDGYRRNQEWKEKITAGIKPTEAEASYPVSIRLRLEEQRQLLRDILIEGNNLLPWREATTDLDDLKKELYIYASKRHSKTPGDSSADYAFDIIRRIEFYRDQESSIKIEAEKPKQKEENAPPLLLELEEIAEDKSLGILRRWENGKYKCSSLSRFILQYIKRADNLTPALIRDYLISERTGKPYSNKNIAKEMKLYGPGRRT